MFQEEQPTIDDYDELTKDLVDNNMLEFDIAIADEIVIYVQGCPKPLVKHKLKLVPYFQQEQGSLPY